MILHHVDLGCDVLNGLQPTVDVCAYSNKLSVAFSYSVGCASIHQRNPK